MNSDMPIDPILEPNISRYILDPDESNPAIFKMYKTALASFWQPSEIKIGSDLEDLENPKKMGIAEKNFVMKILAFFAASDGIVNENLALRFYNEVQLPEARAFYGIQIGMETVHAHTYSMFIKEYEPDIGKRAELFRAIQLCDSIKAKADWAIKYITSTESFAIRLCAFAAVELIFFSSSFVSIFWLKKKGLLPGLAVANDYISRDEGLHGEFACLLFSMLKTKPPIEDIKALIMDAVRIEKIFICNDMLKYDLMGLNKTLMCQYVEYIGDRLMMMLTQTKIYNTPNPFDWMDLISVQLKADFFLHQVTNYQKPGMMQIGEKGTTSEDTQLLDDF
jgi:ribonucleotide reductase beta subunit family protein with ferritin-like domain